MGQGQALIFLTLTYTIANAHATTLCDYSMTSHSPALHRATMQGVCPLPSNAYHYAYILLMVDCNSNGVVTILL